MRFLFVRAVACIKRTMARFSLVQGVELAIVPTVILIFATVMHENGVTFHSSAVAGLVTFKVVDVLGRANRAADLAVKGGLGAFLYLEVLDAPFSFGGVIGAFALARHLFRIASGLGVGTMSAGSMTMCSSIRWRR